MTPLKGVTLKLRQLDVGDSFTVECKDRRAVQLRLARYIAAFGRTYGNGWKRFSTAQIFGGVLVRRLPDAL